jgi:hypothetical protein
MKRWAILTVAAYAVCLLLLTVPLVVLASIDWSTRGQPPRITFPPAQAVQVFQEWGYWTWVSIFIAAQGILLLVPVRRAGGRPVRRRHVGWLIATSSFLFANLVLAGVFCILFGIFGDAGYAPVEFFATTAAQNPLLIKAAALLRVSAPSDFLLGIGGVVATLLTLWGVWLIVFYRFSVTADPLALNARLVRWLLRGSILELLIAVPSHIAVRGRSDCCAGIGTFWGIATGISVMLLSFGPGVLFLFAHRMRGLRPQHLSDEIYIAPLPDRPQK